ncbi:MAG TPA: EcsC family protein [Chitinophagaceae bacterium]|nr:EcsC family protein [Chitinophagaceae bacterium]
MPDYNEVVLYRLKIWQQQMIRKPSVLNRLASRVQKRMNALIPEKVHGVITTAIKQMIRGVLFGAKLTTSEPATVISLQETETKVLERIGFYKRTAAAEGGLTGAGGILLGLADFPLLLGLKLKLLFEIAALYGYSVEEYKERVYILYIFQLAFSSQERRTQVYQRLLNWESESRHLPDDINHFDWRTFQQEYRDYIDLAKMAQLVPVIGAPVGLVVNYHLIKKLGTTAMNAYRMRWQRKQIGVGS